MMESCPGEFSQCRWNIALCRSEENIHLCDPSNELSLSSLRYDVGTCNCCREIITKHEILKNKLPCNPVLDSIDIIVIISAVLRYVPTLI